MRLNEKLHRVRYRVNRGKPHIRLDPEVCSRCTERACMAICPVEAYFEEEGQVMLRWEDCLECGACRIGCPHLNIEWRFPRGGYGISHKFG